VHGESLQGVGSRTRDRVPAHHRRARARLQSDAEYSEIRRARPDGAGKVEVPAFLQLGVAQTDFPDGSRQIWLQGSGFSLPEQVLRGPMYGEAQGSSREPADECSSRLIGSAAVIAMPDPPGYGSYRATQPLWSMNRSLISESVNRGYSQ
jgi:hypothetical protein